MSETLLMTCERNPRWAAEEIARLRAEEADWSRAFERHATKLRAETDKRITAAVAAERVKADRMRKWILAHHDPSRIHDHACGHCMPGGDLVIDGFSCVPHLAITAAIRSTPEDKT